MAKLPALPSIQTGNAKLDTWLGQLKERVEVREGERGNPWEAAVTRRDLKAVEDAFSKMNGQGQVSTNGTDIVFEMPGGGTASWAIDKFIDSIKNLQVYKDLMKRLDDPSRFDNLPGEIRDIVSKSIADEAAKLGTQIGRVEKISESKYRALAYQVDTLTASVQGAQAGIREVDFVVAKANFAQAGKITQLEASLGNYYQDGTPGRAILEEQMTATADRVAGLSSQWTLKVQAGKAFAGVGLAATEDGAGNAVSAFIIAANKFAIVDPNTYTTGLTNTPDNAHIPFGVDSYGIYMNTNVYIRGNMRVDTGGKTLVDGLRGSAQLASSSAWSATTASNLIYSWLGKGSTAPNNNHLVIGDTVTMGTGSSAVTRTWNGTAWVNPGVIINGNLLVSGSVSAGAINTNGLIIRDNAGNPILGAGNQLNVNYIDGLGALATQSDARIGSTVKFPDGTTLNTQDFINRLSKIDSGNIGTFMATAAIGTAYIGNAAVNTLQIAGNAVTVPVGRSGGDVSIAGADWTINPSATALLFDEYIDFGTGVNAGQGMLIGICSFFMRSLDDAMGQIAYYINGGSPQSVLQFGLRIYNGGDTDMSMPVTYPFIVPSSLSGNVRVSVRVTCIQNGAGDYHPFTCRMPRLILLGGKR
ncbi:hypothetical protein CCO03_16915 [Comamonas serinivorans]|uniref:Tip attachment protein J central straight fiber domain-containing protein n=1 Tax=Comamonas serinivorans TaxID=1082851 RepID=A0A1Y0ERJ6_9BURK|nr:hypothetical protein CCO03_16915 [Comamonas serinivorans]